MFEMDLLAYHRTKNNIKKFSEDAETYYMRCRESLLNDIFFCILHHPFKIYFIGAMY